MRWYFFTSKQPWDGYRFSMDTIGEGVRLFLNTLWNTYGFFVLYENAASGGRRRAATPPTDLDRWILSRLGATVEVVTERLDAFDATVAGARDRDFVDDLSNWYVRRSRRRFWDGDARAFATLRECLVTVAQLLAPFTPFVADEIYDNLDGAEPSRAPDRLAGRRRSATSRSRRRWRRRARRWRSGCARARRRRSSCASRCARRSSWRPAASARRSSAMADVVREELNVKALRFVDEADELGSYELKPNYRALGPRFGKDMPQVAAAVAALDADRVAAALREGRTVGVIDRRPRPRARPPTTCCWGCSRWRATRSSARAAHAVALELAIDDELRREGLAREVVRAVQNARKDAGPRGLGPDRADARRRRRAARRRPRARAASGGRGARDVGDLRRDGDGAAEGARSTAAR